MKIGNLEVYGIIYKIKNIKNNKIYIGQTIYPFNLRYSNKGVGIERVYGYHKSLKENEYGYNPHLLSSIEKYGFDSFEVNEVFDFAFSRKELDIKERIWIQIYDSFRNGYNRNIGGEGNAGFDGLKGSDNPMSKKVVQLSLEGKFIKEWDCMANAERELGMGGRISSACNGEKKSIGGYMWMYYEDYLINKDKINPYDNKIGDYNKIPVIQLDLKGNFLNKFNCITSASKLLEKTSISKISDCCKRKRHSAYGYLWVYEEDYNNNNIPTYEVKHNGKPKEIVKLTLNGEFICEFENIISASRELGNKIGGQGNISQVCSGKRQSHKGFIYMYKDEYYKVGCKPYKKRTSKTTPILLLNSDNTINKRYDSITESAKDLGISNGLVQKYINNKTKKPKYKLIKEENYYKNTIKG